MEILDVKVVETGKDEKYLILTNDGLFVCKIPNTERRDL